jgi:uncharacterized protein YaiE (UPF0345 family)
MQNVDELFFTTVSAKSYEIDFVVIYGSPAGAGTPDIKLDYGEDATARGWMNSWGFSTADAGTGATILTNQTATIAFGTAAADRMVKGFGAITGNGGTFRIRWAQNTSGVNATIVRAGSVLRYRQLN